MHASRYATSWDNCELSDEDTIGYLSLNNPSHFESDSTSDYYERTSNCGSDYGKTPDGLDGVFCRPFCQFSFDEFLSSFFSLFAGPSLLFTVCLLPLCPVPFPASICRDSNLRSETDAGQHQCLYAPNNTFFNRLGLSPKTTASCRTRIPASSAWTLMLVSRPTARSSITREAKMTIASTVSGRSCCACVGTCLLTHLFLPLRGFPRGTSVLRHSLVFQQVRCSCPKG